MHLTARLIVALIGAPFLAFALACGCVYLFASTLVDFVAGNVPKADKAK
jgi:hypothetical protein